MIEIDLDSFLKIYTDYEARKEAAREWELKNFGKVDENHISHLATCAKGEAEKAFEAIKVLVEYARELERQREWLVNELCVSTRCDFPSQIECKYRTERGYYCPERKEKFRCWLAHAEQASKEAGE